MPAPPLTVILATVKRSPSHRSQPELIVGRGLGLGLDIRRPRRIVNSDLAIHAGHARSRHSDE